MQKSWTCARCKTTTYNLNDIRHRHCEPCDGLGKRPRKKPKKPLPTPSGEKIPAL